MRLGEELIGVLGIDPHDQAPLRAGRHRHVAADKKDETAKHAPLADIGLSRDQLTNPVGEILVVRHARIIIFERQVPWPLLARVRLAAWPASRTPADRRLRGVSSVLVPSPGTQRGDGGAESDYKADSDKQDEIRQFGLS
jgi:hypothetical protein